MSLKSELSKWDDDRLEKALDLFSRAHDEVSVLFLWKNTEQGYEFWDSTYISLGLLIVEIEETLAIRRNTSPVQAGDRLDNGREVVFINGEVALIAQGGGVYYTLFRETFCDGLDVERDGRVIKAPWPREEE